MNLTLIKTTLDDHRITKLAAIAIALHMAEAIIRSPLLGVKLGIANIVTLYVSHQYGFGAAAWVSILLVFASGLTLGKFLSPTFVLSLSGALVSLSVLWLATHLSKPYFSVIFLSNLAAFGHIAGQLLIVRLWLILHAGISYFIPIFALAALFLGLINGLVTQKLITKKL